jgi:hypothetical protein
MEAGLEPAPQPARKSVNEIEAQRSTSGPVRADFMKLHVKSQTAACAVFVCATEARFLIGIECDDNRFSGDPCRFSFDVASVMLWI